MNTRFEHNQYVKETSKVSEIVDNLNNLRFKVVLDDKQSPGQYFVLVLAYTDGNEEEILREQFSVLEQAMSFFNKTVEKYVYLIKSETYNPHDIRIYADKIGYHNVYPACCFTCKWSKLYAGENHIFINENPELSGKFFCTHPTIFKQYDKRSDEEQVVINPIVQALCVCDAFESNYTKPVYN